MKSRVVVADDNPRMLNELASLLRGEFEVVATATDGQAARECIHRHNPDIAVLDLIMPIASGLELAREFAKNGSPTKIIICSVENDTETIDAVLSSGARGYVFKIRAAKDLVLAVKAVASGQSFRSPNET